LNILVADDHALMREGVKLSLQGLDPSIRVTEAEDADRVRQVLQQDTNIDMILLDLFMPGSDGFRLLTEICQIHQETPVIILSGSQATANIKKAIECGASSYIPKTLPSEEMLRIMRHILDGGVYIPEGYDLSENTSLNQINDADAPKLTKRQKQVLELLANGKTNKDIARTLNLSEYTVKIHVTAIFRELNVSNRTQAVIVAKQHGLTVGDIVADIEA